MKKLMRLVGEYKRAAFLTPLFVIFEVILEIYIPFLMSKIIDVGIKNSDMAYVSKVGGLMILMSLLALFFGAMSGRFAAVASMGFGKNVRKALFYKLQEFSFSNIDKYSTPSLITRLTTDITNLQNAFMMITRMLVRSPVMLVGATFMAVRINSRLAMIFFIAIPVLAVALIFISTRAFPRFKEMLKRYDFMNSSVQEDLTSIRVVKTYVREDYENKKFADSARSLKNAQVGAEKLIIMNAPFMQFIMYSCMISISWFGGNMIISKTMEAGQLMSFISYVTQILMSLMMISFAFVGLVMSRASVSRIVEVLGEEIDIKDDENDENLTVKDGSVEFKNVSFKYGKDSENYNIENISLKINPGETVGIIGGTGSAKTTLVSLIPRLYDVNEGEVLVGGEDVRKYKIKNLRSAVAMVLQKNTLFSGSISDNIKWGDLNASYSEVEAVCKDAAADDFVKSFPDGYDTDLGQGGVNVSGGQKQRLCIARALLKKPKILILDDSTSAVDTATDAKIREAFKKQKDTTVIIIAQRITSVCEADKIIVLDDGKIAEQGSHEELIAQDGIYKELYELQNRK